MKTFGPETPWSHFKLMLPKQNKYFITETQAAEIARESIGLEIGTSDIRNLIKLELLPNFGTEFEPLILEEHARQLVGRVGSSGELAFASLRAVDIPSDLDLDGHQLIQLTGDLAISFNPKVCSGTALQALIRSFRMNVRLGVCDKQWARTISSIGGSLCVWSSATCDYLWWEQHWHLCELKGAKTTTVEALVVPMLYGSKARVSSFVVSTIKQHMGDEAAVCDLMAGTGVITRHLLPYYPVYANDAALFASTLVTSQSLAIDQKVVEDIVRRIRPLFEANLALISSIVERGLSIESEFLNGPLSPPRLSDYSLFAAACTRFVPHQKPPIVSEIWNEQLDRTVRPHLEKLVLAGRDLPSQTPAVLTTAYWGNCYFGLRQAAEVDSLRRAIALAVTSRERPLIEAVFLAAVDACASGPHYAQPPPAKTEFQIRQLIEKRSKSVFSEFELRLSLTPKRPKSGIFPLTVYNLNWRDALHTFNAQNRMCVTKAVYMDPPYSRLQYSRYYHVFDTLLRYDYPGCEGSGRTSERAKRFSSAFDCREATALGEFREVFELVRLINASFFLSYSSAGTVSLSKLLDLAYANFSNVQVYSVPLQHHSQGIALKNRGHLLELLIVAKP